MTSDFCKALYVTFKKMSEILKSFDRKNQADLVSSIWINLKQNPYVKKYWQSPLAFKSIENEINSKGNEAYEGYQSELQQLIIGAEGLCEFALSTILSFRQIGNAYTHDDLFEVIWCARFASLVYRMRSGLTLSNNAVVVYARVMFYGIKAIEQLQRLDYSEQPKGIKEKFDAERIEFTKVFAAFVNEISNGKQKDFWKRIALHYQAKVSLNEEELTVAFTKARYRYQQDRSNLQSAQDFGWLLVDCCKRALELKDKKLIEVLLSELNTFDETVLAAESEFAEDSDSADLAFLFGDKRLFSAIKRLRIKLPLVIKGYDAAFNNSGDSSTLLMLVNELKERPGDVLLRCAVMLIFANQGNYRSAFVNLDEILKDVNDSLSRAEKLCENGAHLLVEKCIRFLTAYKSAFYKGGIPPLGTKRTFAFLQMIKTFTPEKFLKGQTDYKLLIALEECLYFCVNVTNEKDVFDKTLLIQNHLWINDFYEMHWKAFAALRENVYSVHRGLLLARSKQADAAKPFLMNALKRDASSPHNWINLSEVYEFGSSDWLKCICKAIVMPLSGTFTAKDRIRARKLLCVYFIGQKKFGETIYEITKICAGDKSAEDRFLYEVQARKYISLRLYNQGVHNFSGKLKGYFNRTDYAPKSTDEFCDFWAKQADDLIGRKTETVCGCILSIVHNRVAKEDHLHIWWRGADSVEHNSYVLQKKCLEITDAKPGQPVLVTVADDGMTITEISERLGELWDGYPRHSGMVVAVDRVRRFIDVAISVTEVVTIDMRRIANASNFQIGDACHLGVFHTDKRLQVLFIERCEPAYSNLEFVKEVKGVITHKKGASNGELLPSDWKQAIKVPYRLIKGGASGKEISGLAVLQSRRKVREPEWELITINN